MKFSKSAIALGILALAASATSAFAQDNNGMSALYGGVSVGQARATIDDKRITNQLASKGFLSDISDREHSLGYKIFGGYQLTKNFALEAGYFSLGKFGYTAMTVPAGSLTGDARMRGVNLDAVGTLPLTERFSAFARAGVTYADTRDRFSGSGLVVVNNPNPSERAFGFKAGLGVQYSLTPALALRAEIERYRIKDAVGHRGDVDMATIGLVYRFGATSSGSTGSGAQATAAPVATAYEQPLAAPVVAPAPVSAPVAAPRSEKITYAAATFFDFDKSVLKPSGKQKLDELMAHLQGMKTEVVVAAGYTDSIGGERYNDALSLRRADAVKAYLVAKGMAASGIYTEGKGESQPVADNRTTDGRAQNRRVQIEIVATQK